MIDHIEETPEYHLILKLAQALRDEFGVMIDAHPGGIGSEAGVVNRAFRATGRAILGELMHSEGDPVAMLPLVLRRLALGRLAEVGVKGENDCSTMNRNSGIAGWPISFWPQFRSSKTWFTAVLAGDMIHTLARSDGPTLSRNANSCSDHKRGTEPPKPPTCFQWSSYLGDSNGVQGLPGQREQVTFLEAVNFFGGWPRSFVGWILVARFHFPAGLRADTRPPCV